jgi:hypothetical protein
VIRVLLHGRLGNQLFQTATALALAKEREAKVLLDPTLLELNSDREFRRLPLLKFDFPRNLSCVGWDRFNRRWRKKRTFELTGLPVYREKSPEYDPSIKSVPQSTVLTGFFQCERYFTGIEPQLRSWFDLRPWLTLAPECFREIAMEPGTIGVHVRRTDYLDNVHAHFNVGFHS